MLSNIKHNDVLRLLPIWIFIDMLFVAIHTKYPIKKVKSLESFIVFGLFFKSMYFFNIIIVLPGSSQVT